MNDREQELSIIHDVLRGNKASYTFLVDKYKNKIYGLLLKMGASTEDAKDMTQETFITAYRKLEVIAQTEVLQDGYTQFRFIYSRIDTEERSTRFI